MKRRLFFLLVFVAVIMTVGCQEVSTLYTAPEIVEFTPQVEFDGVLTNEIYVIEKGADPAVFGNHILISNLPEGVYEAPVDIYALSLTGIWYVAVRGVDDYQGDIIYSDFAYSYEDADVEGGTFTGTFGFRNRTTSKPGELRVQGGF